MYKLDRFGGIVRVTDGAGVPADPANLDYAEYLKWQAEGNTPTPYEPDPTEGRGALKAAAQAALDKSDTTLLRCYEKGVSVPAAWVSYRDGLRGIVTGSSTASELPTRPPYPA